MQGSWVVLLALLAHSVASAKLKAAKASIETDPPADWCVGNVFPFPDKRYHVRGVGSGDAAFGKDEEEVAAALTKHADWGPDSFWEFKAHVISGYEQKLKFGFSSGFLEFEIGPEDVMVEVDSQIKTTDSKLEYLPQAGSRMPPILSEHPVEFYDICLRPRPCSKFTEDCPHNTHQLVPENLGSNIAKCCKPLYCKDQPEAACEPLDEWTQHPDFETKLGNTQDHCCIPKLCSADLCAPSTKYQLLNSSNTGGVLRGSDIGKCCEKRLCEAFSGCSLEKEESKLPASLEDGSPRLGSTEEECCHMIQCSEFNCIDGTQGGMWKNKSNPEGTGHDYKHCCDPEYCKLYTCSDSAKWKRKNPTDPPTQGFSDEKCCDEIYCSDFDCETESGGTHSLMVNSKKRHGGSVADCCEPKMCTNYKCSSDTEWVKKAVTATDGGLQVPLQGFSDVACCEPKYCSDFDCSHTKWKKNPALAAKTQGSTYEECCEKILCADMNCTTDYDGDGEGTKWRKKVDTNALKHQGSLDEECCDPKKCIAFNVEAKLLTKWEKKPAEGNHLGSTVEECYDKLLCSNFCGCKANEGKKLIDKPQETQGSTVAECCLDIKPASK